MSLTLRNQKGGELTYEELDHNLRQCHNPTGTILSYIGETEPDEYYFCHGQLKSRVEDAKLFAILGVRFGEGDGGTTFQLPDFRGEFLRGADAGKGVDSGRELGSNQNDQFQNHAHSVSWNNNTYFRAQPAPHGTSRGVGTVSGGWDRFQGLNISIGNPNSGNRGSETRPRNVAVHFIIKR